MQMTPSLQSLEGQFYEGGNAKSPDYGAFPWSTWSATTTRTQLS